MKNTLGATLAEQARKTPDAPFIYFGEETISYADMQGRAVRASAALGKLGIGRGDRVAIAGANTPDWLTAYFGTVRLGAILVTLNVVYREREFTYMLGQSGTRLLICEEEAGGFAFRPFLEALAPKIPTVERVLYLGDSGGQDSWRRLVDAEPGRRTPVDDAGADLDGDTPAVILYTSGTTGDPKGATLTHRSLLASAAGQADRFGQGADDVMLGVLPFNHVGGMTCAVGATLVSGGAVALLPRFHPDLMAEVFPRRRPSLFLGVPTMYRMLLDSEKFARCDASSMRQCVIGGSNVEPALVTQIIKRFDGAPLANLYGLSESSGACVISPLDDSVELVSTTIGTMLADFEARIVDDARTPLAAGEVGELEVRGACVAAGYWEKPEATAAAFHVDGWLATGDVGAMSEDGHITINARKKEMFIRGGYNVYPAEVENVLTTDPAVAMCAVIGIPDATFGETGYAFVVPAPDHAVDTAALINKCRSELAEYKVPSHIEIVESLPLTPAGKIRKVLLRPA